MRPSEKLKKVISLTRLCARACGADIADPNYKLNSITYLTIMCITVYFIFSIYTVTIKINEGWGILLQSFCMVGSVIQGITKLLSGIMYSLRISSQSAFITSVYAKYESKGEDYAAILDKCMSLVQTVVKLVAFIYIMMVMVVVSGPVVIWSFTGRRLFAMQFYLPFVDPDTIYGYIITMGAQLTCLFFGAFGNFAGDMYMLLFFAQVSIMADIMKLKVKELNEAAEDFDSALVMKILLDLIDWHQTSNNFVAMIDDTFFWINTAQVTMSAVSMVLSLFIMFTGDWPGSYGYILMLFMTLYMYCGMGTITEVANDDITTNIYDIHFYNMSTTQQKLVRLMLMKSQSPKRITVGGVIPLSVSTGLQVTKSVYSVFMMLVNR